MKNSLLKKAAMFGLDARIALAIFGSLSVISGAALYSAIKEARVTALRNDFIEYGKAIESYIVDTGSLLPKSTSLGAHLMTGNLVENIENISGWNGPYLDGTFLVASDSNGDWTRKTNFNYYKLAILRDSSYASCVSSCNIWVRFDMPAMYRSLIEDLDLSIDGNIDGGNGDLRYSLGTNYSVLYKYITIPMSLIN